MCSVVIKQSQKYGVLLQLRSFRVNLLRIELNVKEWRDITFAAQHFHTPQLWIICESSLWSIPIWLRAYDSMVPFLNVLRSVGVNQRVSKNVERKLSWVTDMLKIHYIIFFSAGISNESPETHSSGEHHLHPYPVQHRASPHAHFTSTPPIVPFSSTISSRSPRSALPGQGCGESACITGSNGTLLQVNILVDSFWLDKDCYLPNIVALALYLLYRVRIRIQH